MRDMFELYKNFTRKKFKLIVKLNSVSGSSTKLRTSQTSELLRQMKSSQSRENAINKGSDLFKIETTMVTDL